MSLPIRHPSTSPVFQTLRRSQCPSCSVRRLSPISRFYHSSLPSATNQPSIRSNNTKPQSLLSVQTRTIALKHARSFSTSQLLQQQQEPYVLAPSLYHSLADQTMDSLFANLEALAEKDNSIDVEFSSGVLTLTLDDRTYVINKQPPNKQIWLSSPISGPKRFDWIFNGNASDEGSGEWVYARDGTTMNEILCAEVGIGYDVPQDEA